MLSCSLFAKLFASGLFFDTILEMLKLCGVDLVIPFYTWIVIIIGCIAFLIPSCRKYWWIPLVTLSVAGVICIYLIGPLNSLNVAAQAYWFISAAICFAYGYLIATIILGVKKLVVWATRAVKR